MKGSGLEAALGGSVSDGADERVDVPFIHVTLKPPILLSLSPPSPPTSPSNASSTSTTFLPTLR